MAVQQIGTRLVRCFGNGDNLKKVVTEVVDGKTFTNVFDAKGTLIKQRVKAFSEEMVGDKLVKTKTTVTDIQGGDLFKKITDSVYKIKDKVKNFVGGRSTKYVADGEDFIDCIKDTSDRYFNRTRLYDRTSYRNGLRLTRGKPQSYVGYNNKGLPKPDELLSMKAKDMSLKEMREWHLKNHPQRPYTDYPGYEFLDEPIKDIKLNRLDELL